MKAINKEITIDIIRTLPQNKMEVLKKALYRNYLLTTTWELPSANLQVYKEGFYLTLLGTRCSFSAWVYDMDGELVHGRKPKNLTLLYEDNGNYFIDWKAIA